MIDGMLADPDPVGLERFNLMLAKCDPPQLRERTREGLETLELTRLWLSSRPRSTRRMLYTIIYFQGITALRRGETENCVMCRGESSCILPISAAAVHNSRRLPPGDPTFQRIPRTIPRRP